VRSAGKRFGLALASLVAAIAVYISPAPVSAGSCQVCENQCNQGVCDTFCSGGRPECGTVSCPLGGISTICW
jgi:hypothetical protein